MARSIFEHVLIRHQPDFAGVMSYDFKKENGFVFDFTESNTDLFTLDLNNEHAFSTYIFDCIRQAGTRFGIGCYNENRMLYKRSEVFGGDRSIHLGIDIWAPAGDAVFAPLEGKVHSFRNNKSHGDYGPTIILEHTLEEHIFYTLYGHLSLESLENISTGDRIAKGEKFATLGAYHENVHWPPHLHFQLIRDLLGNEGDFPGVSTPRDRDLYLSLCPDPNLILQISTLNNHQV